jgi:hypothetical protein
VVILSRLRTALVVLPLLPMIQSCDPAKETIAMDECKAEIKKEYRDVDLLDLNVDAQVKSAVGACMSAKGYRRDDTLTPVCTGPGHQFDSVCFRKVDQH